MAYASAAQLKTLSVAAAALASVASGDQTAALQAASDLADSYIRSRYTLPLLDWSDDLRRAVCSIATYDLMSHRGYNPETGGDPNIRARYDDAIAWLKDVARGVVAPSVTDSAPASSAGAGARVSSKPPRGW